MLLVVVISAGLIAKKRATDNQRSNASHSQQTSCEGGVYLVDQVNVEVTSQHLTLDYWRQFSEHTGNLPRFAPCRVRVVTSVFQVPIACCIEIHQDVYCKKKIVRSLQPDRLLGFCCCCFVWFCCLVLVLFFGGRGRERELGQRATAKNNPKNCLLRVYVLFL